MLSKWAISAENKELGYDEFAAAEINRTGVKDQMDFKNKTDRVV